MRGFSWPARDGVTIVAEIGPNHAGDLNKAIALIEAAYHAGADAVKLQVYEPWQMVPAESDHPAYVLPPGGPWGGRRLRDVYAQGRTPIGWVPKLIDVARSFDLMLFASVFHRNTIPMLEAVDVPAYKVASPEVADRQLVTALAHTGRPIVLSDGAVERNVMDDVLAELWQEDVDTTVLRCVSAYPASASGYDLGVTFGPAAWRHLYPEIREGLSDHTRGSAVACAAVGLGATMVEKHLMLPYVAYESLPLDAGHSLTPEDFAHFVNDVREAATAVNGPAAPKEVPWRRRLAYEYSMDSGDVIKTGDIRTARADRGVEASEMYHVIGATLMRHVNAGDPVMAEEIDVG